MCQAKHSQSHSLNSSDSKVSASMSHWSAMLDCKEAIVLGQHAAIAGANDCFQQQPDDSLS